MDTSINHYIRGLLKFLEEYFMPPKAKKPVNEKLSKHIEWFIFVFGFCALPYIFRAVIACKNHEKLPDFYVSEMDLFSICIALSISVFVDVRKYKKNPFNMGDFALYGIIVVYIVFLCIAIWSSLGYEKQIAIAEDDCFSLLKNCKNADNLISDIEAYKSDKAYLFNASIGAVVFTMISTYLIVFKVNE